MQDSSQAAVVKVEVEVHYIEMMALPVLEMVVMVV
jgi:hypothetical protein